MPLSGDECPGDVSPDVRIAWMIHVVAPVGLGAAIYLLFRAPHLSVFRWVRAVGAEAIVASWRSTAAPVTEAIPGWILYSLPDGLWVYGLSAAMVLVWQSHVGPARLPWLYSGVMLGTGGEIGQAARVVPGTFDTADLILSIAAFAAASLLTPYLSGIHDQKALIVDPRSRDFRRPRCSEHGIGC